MLLWQNNMNEEIQEEERTERGNKKQFADVTLVYEENLQEDNEFADVTLVEQHE